jgi:hypothetical protein
MNRSISSPRNASLSANGVSAPEPLASQVPMLDFSPAEIVRHQTAHWRGVQMEIVQIISHEHFEYSFKQQYHLLIAVEQGARYSLYARAREGECELGTLAIGKRCQEQISATG